jgi:hypothetical protein
MLAPDHAATMRIPLRNGTARIPVVNRASERTSTISVPFDASGDHQDDRLEELCDAGCVGGLTATLSRGKG